MPSDDIIARFREIAGDTTSWGGIDARIEGGRIIFARGRRMDEALSRVCFAFALLICAAIGVGIGLHAWRHYALLPALLVIAGLLYKTWRVANARPPSSILSSDMKDFEILASEGVLNIYHWSHRAQPVSVGLDDVAYFVYCKLIARTVRNTGVYAVTSDRTSYQLIKYSIGDAKRLLRVLGHTCDRPAIVLDTFEATKGHRDSPCWSLQMDATDRDALLKWGEVVYSPGELQTEYAEPITREVGI